MNNISHRERRFGIIFRKLLKILNKHTLLRLFIASLLILVGGTILFYKFEVASPNSPYHSLSDAIKAILIYFISGFDTDAPATTGGLITSLLMIIFGIALVGLFTANIAAIIVEKKLKEGLGLEALTVKDHIIICGWNYKAEQIVKELHNDEAPIKYPVVIISNQIDEHPIPDNDLVDFVKGDPSDEATLKKANIMYCKAAIILADITQENRKTNTPDAQSILTALAIETINPDVYTCVEVLNPKNIQHLKRANVDEIISVSELTGKLLAQSVMNLGLSGFITEVLSTNEGCEFYRIKLKLEYCNKTFLELFTTFKEKFNYILVSVQRGNTLYVNPENDFKVKEEDELYIIAKDFPENIARGE